MLLPQLAKNFSAELCAKTSIREWHQRKCWSIHLIMKSPLTIYLEKSRWIIWNYRNFRALSMIFIHQKVLTMWEDRLKKEFSSMIDQTKNFQQKEWIVHKICRIFLWRIFKILIKKSHHHPTNTQTQVQTIILPPWILLQELFVKKIVSIYRNFWLQKFISVASYINF